MHMGIVAPCVEYGKHWSRSTWAPLTSASEEIYPVPSGAGGLQANPPRGRQTALSGWGPVASAAMQWGCPFLRVGLGGPRSSWREGGPGKPSGVGFTPTGCVIAVWMLVIRLFIELVLSLTP